jgi:hypothetical protein
MSFFVIIITFVVITKAKAQAKANAKVQIRTNTRVQIRTTVNRQQVI